MMRAGDLGKVRWPDGRACATSFLPVGQRFAGKRSVHRRTARVPLDRTASSGHICASITLPGNRFAPIRTLPPRHTPPRQKAGTPRSSGRLPVSGIGSRSSILIGIALTAFRWNHRDLPPPFCIARRQRWSPAVEDAPRMTKALSAIVRGFKARLYLTAEQADRLNRWAGSLRFLWNRLLEAEQAEYAISKKLIPKAGGQPNRPPPFLLALRARCWRRSTNRYVVKPDDDFATRLKAVRQFGIRRLNSSAWIRRVWPAYWSHEDGPGQSQRDH